ncbi:DUF2157 domain-containing protein [Phenylobacterium sp.]|jgi:hypothetical protein|uniref:DUF2157 domain-containing protein n=1 Tax=Phenylobacterium sp. TaxID=1871053 RepID=UPI002E34463E|nr:DUF2157 domain-containing protein [Phenylobacterium sp.]HEX2561552.1 DUF2157 domain-containing protein [Phenylobacterium sp.]
MAGYRKRLEQDLERWIAAGLVPADSRAAILGSVGEGRRLDAATTLAAVGSAFLGIAVIAFVAANWDAIPRLARFVLVLGVFAGLCGGAAWAARRERPGLRNGLLAIAALVYAAAIGLTGQIFDIAGSPPAALHGAGLAAGLLALAGRSSGAAMAGLVLLGLGDLSDGPFQEETALPWLAFGAPLGAGLAWAWRSSPLAHTAGLGLVVGAMLLLIRLGPPNDAGLLLTSAGFAALAAGARWRRDTEGAAAGGLFGWCVLGALAFFVIAGFEGKHFEGLPHRMVWLALSAGLLALGRADRHGAVSGLAVISLIGAVCAILFDLGLGLMSAAGVFLVSALAALVAGWLMRRRKPA